MWDGFHSPIHEWQLQSLVELAGPWAVTPEMGMRPEPRTDAHQSEGGQGKPWGECHFPTALLRDELTWVSVERAE